MALCLNCGEVKFGAICPCPKCEVSSTGNVELDIVFSDHHIPEKSLKDLGKVVEHFSAKTDDTVVAFWSFIRYISENQQSILQADVPDAFAERVAEIYSQDEIPKVTLKPLSLAPPAGYETGSSD